MKSPSRPHPGRDTMLEVRPGCSPGEVRRRVEASGQEGTQVEEVRILLSWPCDLRFSPSRHVNPVTGDMRHPTAPAVREAPCPMNAPPVPLDLQEARAVLAPILAELGLIAWTGAPEARQLVGFGVHLSQCGPDGRVALAIELPRRMLVLTLDELYDIEHEVVHDLADRLRRDYADRVADVEVDKDWKILLRIH